MFQRLSRGTTSTTHNKLNPTYFTILQRSSSFLPVSRCYVRSEPYLPVRWIGQANSGEYSLVLTGPLLRQHGNASPGSTIVLWMTWIDEFRAELLAKRYRYARPGVEPTPWGARMMCDRWTDRVGLAAGTEITIAAPR